MNHHSLQLFDSTTTYARAVSAFVQEGLAAGDAVLVLATASNWRTIDGHCREAGVDLDAARAAGTLTVCDAEQTLARIMTLDQINNDRVRATIGAMVEGLRQRHRHLRMYGEMVDLLVRQNQFSTAVKLEQFWNDVIAKGRLTMFCGYTAEHFGNPRNAASLRQICGLHTHAHADPADVLANYLLRTHAAC